MTLGERIKQLRSERGWSITETARRVQGSRSFLYQVERDQNSPSLAWLEKAAAAFGLSVIEMLAPLYGDNASIDAAWDEVNAAFDELGSATDRLNDAIYLVARREMARRRSEKTA